MRNPATIYRRRSVITARGRGLKILCRVKHLRARAEMWCYASITSSLCAASFNLIKLHSPLPLPSLRDYYCSLIFTRSQFHLAKRSYAPVNLRVSSTCEILRAPFVLSQVAKRAKRTPIVPALISIDFPEQTAGNTPEGELALRHA